MSACHCHYKLETTETVSSVNLSRNSLFKDEQITHSGPLVGCKLTKEISLWHAT